MSKCGYGSVSYEGHDEGDDDDDSNDDDDDNDHGDDNGSEIIESKTIGSKLTTFKCFLGSLCLQGVI